MCYISILPFELKAILDDKYCNELRHHNSWPLTATERYIRPYCSCVSFNNNLINIDFILHLKLAIDLKQSIRILHDVQIINTHAVIYFFKISLQKI